MAPRFRFASNYYRDFTKFCPRLQEKESVGNAPPAGAGSFTARAPLAPPGGGGCAPRSLGRSLVQAVLVLGFQPLAASSAPALQAC